LIVTYIDEHKDEFGVEPIVTELKSAGLTIAPSTYYAARSRPPSRRVVADAVATGQIRAVHKANMSVSAAIDTPTLVSLNRSVDVDRKTSSEVAKQFVADKSLAATSPSGSGSIVVGAGNFSEASTLAEIYAAVLRSGGYTVNVQTIGNRETYLSALVSGQLTIVPEYVGTLTEFLNKKANGANAAAQASSDLTKTVTALTALGKSAGLTFGKASAAQDQNAFAVTRAFADKHKVTTLSELAATCSGIVLGGPPECPTRPFCQPGLTGKYGLRIADFKALDAGGPLTKTALQKGDITLALVFSSDGSLGG
jgi:osmoprotectant transport system substrate-binding protein